MVVTQPNLVLFLSAFLSYYVTYYHVGLLRLL